MSDSLFKIDARGTLTEYLGQESDVTLPPEVKYLSAAAFQNNKTLQRLTLPWSLVSVSPEAFRGCSNLTDIYMRGCDIKLQWRLFTDGPTNFTIHFPGECFRFRGLTPVSISKKVYSSGDYHHPSATHFEVWEEHLVASLFGDCRPDGFVCRVECTDGVLEYKSESDETWIERR